MRRLLRSGIPLVLIVFPVLVQVATADSVDLAPGAQEPAVVRSGIDLVHFDVIVTDKRGAVVTGLTADDFEVVEQGTPQTLTVFAAGDREPSADLHLGVLVDVSGSMGDLEDVRRITIQVLNQLPEATDYTLLIVGDEARVAHFTRADFGELLDRVRRINQKEPESTALWDGFRTYLRRVTEQPGRHVLVAFTDGRDTSSTATFVHVLRDLRAAAVTVFGVGFGHGKGSPHGLQLSQVADHTGGITMFPNGPNQMDDVHRRIVTEVRSQYSLGYVSTDQRRDGRWREVKIRLVGPQHKDLRVRARDGYYAARTP